MRSSGSRLRASGRRRGGLAAPPLIVAALALAACGDNLGPPRLTAARYLYDDGTEQTDQHQLYDRTLGTLCTPTEFSDGFTYCEPEANPGFYADDRCEHAVARVPAGEQPHPYVETTFTLGSKVSPSRILRTGPPTTTPAKEYERIDGFCRGRPTETGVDWYTTDDVAIDLAHVLIEPAEVVDHWQVVRLHADGPAIPWRLRDRELGPCDIVSRADRATTWCLPTSVVRSFLYADDDCTIPVIVSPSPPDFTYFDDEQNVIYKRGLELAPNTAVYERFAGTCIQTITTGPTRVFTLGERVTLPTLSRDAHGTGRLQSISLGELPINDDLLHDSMLNVDCAREIDRCVPARIAPVQTWFADPLCGQAVDVAFPYGDPLTAFARKYDGPNADHIFYPVGEPYSGQLYELDTGDTCSTYEPPYQAYSIGPALGEDAFARATLMIE